MAGDDAASLQSAWTQQRGNVTQVFNHCAAQGLVCAGHKAGRETVGVGQVDRVWLEPGPNNQGAQIIGSGTVSGPQNPSAAQVVVPEHARPIVGHHIGSLHTMRDRNHPKNSTVRASHGLTCCIQRTDDPHQFQYIPRMDGQAAAQGPGDDREAAWTHLQVDPPATSHMLVVTIANHFQRAY